MEYIKQAKPTVGPCAITGTRPAAVNFASKYDLRPYLLAPDHQNAFDHLGMYKESVLSNAAQMLAYEIVAKAEGGWTYEEMSIDDNKELACKMEAEALISELYQGLEVGI